MAALWQRARLKWSEGSGKREALLRSDLSERSGVKRRTPSVCIGKDYVEPVRSVTVLFRLLNSANVSAVEMFVNCISRMFTSRTIFCHCLMSLIYLPRFTWLFPFFGEIQVYC